MGALHGGHLALIQQARKQCSTVVVSIFVNPLQFGPTEDFQRYPRSVQSDHQLCREAGVDLVFSPSNQGFYPKDFQTTVKVGRLSRRWESEARPTHFEGVTTVVSKLLGIVRPSHTYFGQKDYQQLLVVKQMVQDLNIHTKIVRCSTIREPDGLALSSRNRYLSERERLKAVCLSKALRLGVQLIREGKRPISVVQTEMRKVIQIHNGIVIDYLTVCDAQTLEPLALARGHMVLLGAIRIGRIRLIDNMLVRRIR